MKKLPSGFWVRVDKILGLVVQKRDYHPNPNTFEASCVMDGGIEFRAGAELSYPTREEAQAIIDGIVKDLP